MTSLIKVKHKLSVAADHNQELKLLWAADKDRPPIYSREQFRRFWDQHIPEARG